MFKVQNHLLPHDLDFNATTVILRGPPTQDMCLCSCTHRSEYPTTRSETKRHTQAAMFCKEKKEAKNAACVSRYVRSKPRN